MGNETGTLKPLPAPQAATLKSFCSIAIVVCVTLETDPVTLKRLLNFLDLRNLSVPSRRGYLNPGKVVVPYTCNIW